LSRAAVIAPAQFHDVPAEAAQHTQLAAEFIGYFTIPAGQGGGVTGGQHRGRIIRQPVFVAP